MTNDLKATVTGVVTGIAGLLSYYNIVIPEAWFPAIVSVGVIVLGWFANKKDA